MGEVEDWMIIFDVRIMKFDTSLEIRRKLAEQHNRAQHNGRESTVPQLLNNFVQLAAEDTQCKKTVVTLMRGGAADCKIRQHGDNHQANEASCPYGLDMWPLRTHSARWWNSSR